MLRPLLGTALLALALDSTPTSAEQMQEQDICHSEEIGCSVGIQLCAVLEYQVQVQEDVYFTVRRYCYRQD